MTVRPLHTDQPPAHTSALVASARAAGVRLTARAGGLVITAPPELRALHAPALRAHGPAVLEWLANEARARRHAAALARGSSKAANKALRLLRRPQRGDRAELLVPCVDSMLAIEGNGGIPVELLTDREAVRIFLDWLHAKRLHYCMQRANGHTPPAAGQCGGEAQVMALRPL